MLGEALVVFLMLELHGHLLPAVGACFLLGENKALPAAVAAYDGVTPAVACIDIKPVLLLLGNGMFHEGDAALVGLDGIQVHGAGVESALRAAPYRPALGAGNLGVIAFTLHLGTAGFLHMERHSFLRLVLFQNSGQEGVGMMDALDDIGGFAAAVFAAEAVDVSPGVLSNYLHCCCVRLMVGIYSLTQFSVAM